MSVAGFDKGIKDTITLQKLLGINEYNKFVSKINELVNEGKLKPTKDGRETNGKYPPLAKKYRIIEEKTDYNYLKEEISREFPLKFSKSHYYRHLDKYEQDQQIVLNLITYHKRMDHPLQEIMSVNERLFDIFKHEKNISVGRIKSVLKNLELDITYLNYYETPEPFIYYSDNKKAKAEILIVENKDTWYTLRKLRQEGIGPFGSLIYGEGKKILKSFEEIGVHQNPCFNNLENSYYYFGDLDDEGLTIFIKLREKAKGIGIDLKMWQEGYKEMIRLAELEDRWRVYKEQFSMNEEQLIELLAFVESDLVERIILQFAANAYIPQEITNYRILKKLLKEE